MFYKKAIPINFAKLLGEHLARSRYFNKVASVVGGLQPTAWLKVEVFSCEFCKIFQNSFFEEQLHLVFCLVFCRDINSFLANVLILYLLKTPENLWFSHVFRGYEMGTLARNRLKHFCEVYSDLTWRKQNDIIDTASCWSVSTSPFIYVIANFK